MPAQGMMMSSPASDQWWAVFHTTHGKDSEEEKAFLGYLSQHEIPAGSPPDVLGQAYAECVAFIEASYGRGAEEEAKPRVFAEMPPAERARVPRSSMANPEMEKPMDAATRPPDLRDKDAGPSTSQALTDPQGPSQATTAPVPGESATPPGSQPEEPRSEGEGPERQYGQRRR